MNSLLFKVENRAINYNFTPSGRLRTQPAIYCQFQVCSFTEIYSSIVGNFLLIQKKVWKWIFYFIHWKWALHSNFVKKISVIGTIVEIRSRLVFKDMIHTGRPHHVGQCASCSAHWVWGSVRILYFGFDFYLYCIFSLPFSFFITPSPQQSSHYCPRPWVLFAQSFHPSVPPLLAGILLSISESVPIFLVSSICSLDST